MFKPERKAWVYFQQPLYGKEIEKHYCKIGPDVDLLGRTDRWLAEPINPEERFGRGKFFRVEIPNLKSKKYFNVSMYPSPATYMTSFTLSFMKESE